MRCLSICLRLFVVSPFSEKVPLNLSWACSVLWRMTSSTMAENESSGFCKQVESERFRKSEVETTTINWSTILGFAQKNFYVVGCTLENPSLSVWLTGRNSRQWLRDSLVQYATKFLREQLTDGRGTRQIASLTSRDPWLERRVFK